MLENIFTLVFGRIKNKASNSKGSQHDSTSTTTTSTTTTTTGRSTGGSTQISAPFNMPPPPPQPAQVPQPPRTLPYPPHNTSSTPISFTGSISNNTSSFRDENNIYTMPNVSIQRRTPLPNGLTGALDDLNGLDDPFKRTTKARMSLPIMQQNKLRRQNYSQVTRRNQFPPQSMGHIYLQHNGETKQAFLPNELTTIDTIWALFVCAFPYLLTMEFMSQPHVKVYIYNPNCNIFYELRDIDDVKHESVLRIHYSDPLLALPSQYHQVRYLSQIPPPKPRRMIQAQNMQQGGGWVGI